MSLRLAALVFGAALGAGCVAPSAPVQQTPVPTPVTRAARTSAALAAATLTPQVPTAVIFADPSTGAPVWPTPPPSCPVSPVSAARPDLGPTLGEAPVWMASIVLPVIPWRNEFIRTVWAVQRGAEGDLALSGRRTEGGGALRFFRQGGERPTEQLRIPMASRVGDPNASPIAARYADHQIYTAAPGPGCYELTARLAEYTRTFTIYIYN